jgi:hypothetical protein
MARSRSLFYWIGWVLAVACTAVVCAHHSGLSSRFEFEGISLVWPLGGGAILAILVHELCDSLLTPRTPDNKRARSDNETKAIRFERTEVRGAIPRPESEAGSTR